MNATTSVLMIAVVESTIASRIGPLRQDRIAAWHFGIYGVAHHLVHDVAHSRYGFISGSCLGFL